MIRRYKRLFILGAGFSAPAGLPLGIELLELVREELKRFFRGSDWDGPLEKEIEEWRLLYPGQTIDLERVLAYSHRKHHLRLLGSDEYFAHGSRSIVAARAAIQRILIQSTPINVPSLYREFADRLCANDVVLTFNYDTLLEQTFDEIGKPYTLTPEWWLKFDTPKRQYIDLIKLHGSIDWYDRHFHDDAVRWHAERGHGVPDRDPVFGPSPSVPTEPLARGPTHEEVGSHILSRIFRVPNYRQHFPIKGDHGWNLVPFILPPAYDKLLGSDPATDLWANLHRTLDAFSSIVIIGYSMPSHDSHAYETLGQLFVNYQNGGDKTYWEQRRVPIQFITKGDSAHLAIKHLPFLKREKTRVWYRGFSTNALKWIDWGDGAR